jgi:protein-disulfide isomerase
MIRALLIGLAWLATFEGPASHQAPDPLAARSKGRRTAAVTVYEMSDFQCPYCRKVRLVYITLPLTSVHPNAVAAAEIALCAARQHRFWPLHDLLFRHQDDWASLPEPRVYLLALGDSAGLDRAKLARCVTSRATAAEVETDAARARRAGARSTPTFYIEGGLIEGAPPIGVFRAVLDSIYQAKTTTAPARPR